MTQIPKLRNYSGQNGVSVVTREEARCIWKHRGNHGSLRLQCKRPEPHSLLSSLLLLPTLEHLATVPSALESHRAWCEAWLPRVSLFNLEQAISPRKPQFHPSSPPRATRTRKEKGEYFYVLLTDSLTNSHLPHRVGAAQWDHAYEVFCPVTAPAKYSSCVSCCDDNEQYPPPPLLHPFNWPDF